LLLVISFHNYALCVAVEKCIDRAVKCLVKALEARELPLRIKIAVIPVITKKFNILSDETVEVYIKEAS